MRRIGLPSWLFVMIALILSILLAFGFEQINLRRENILLIFVGSIMFIMVETKKISFGLFSAFLLVFFFNFFFTEPKYTFIIDDANYIITLTVFMIAVTVLGTLTSSLQKEINQTKDNEAKIEFLYQLSKEFLVVNSLTESAHLIEEKLSALLHRQCWLCFQNDHYNSVASNEVKNTYQKELHYAINEHVIVGYKGLKFDQLDVIIYPADLKKPYQAGLVIDSNQTGFSRQEHEIIQTALLNFSTFVERQELTNTQEKAKLEIEKERLKNALLRSISHDLRTPLTTLQTGTSFLYESLSELDQKTVLEMLLDINNETVQLSEFVDNLLNMTRLNANPLSINKEEHLIDDILHDVYRRVHLRLSNHVLNIIESTSIDKVFADAHLLIQVLVNLVDNAIKHTQSNTTIWIEYLQKEHDTMFRVYDNGGGLDEDLLDVIFNDFTTGHKTSGDENRGFGLGLSICKAIIKAHDGDIKAYNNQIGGATFEFTLPQKKNI